MIAFLLSLLLLFPTPHNDAAMLTCQVRQHRQKRVCWCAPSSRGPWTTYPMWACRLKKGD